MWRTTTPARCARAWRRTGSQQRPRWKVPTLLLWAGSDRCVAPAGSAGFAASAPQAVVAVHEFRPLYHEIFNEPEQAEVFGVLRDWLATLEFPAQESAR